MWLNWKLSVQRFKKEMNCLDIAHLVIKKGEFKFN